MPSLNDLQAAARELAPTTPANQPLRMLPEEAQVLVDLRPSLQDPAKRDQARALRKQLFNLVRQRLPLPQGVRLTVEVDDSSAPDCLVLKDADTGQWLYPTPAPTSTPAPDDGSHGDFASWYRVGYSSGDPVSPADAASVLVDRWYVPGTPTELGRPATPGAILQRHEGGQLVTYVALTPREHRIADTSD